MNLLKDISVISLVWNKGVGSAEALEDNSQLLKKVLVKTLEALKHQEVTSSPLTFNFGIYCLFSLINVAISLGGKTVIEDN